MTILPSEQLKDKFEYGFLISEEDNEGNDGGGHAGSEDAGKTVEHSDEDHDDSQRNRNGKIEENIGKDHVDNRDSQSKPPEFFRPSSIR